MYLRINLVFKRYLYNFFRAWKCFEDGLFIYLFNVDIINTIFNYILIFIYINFLIAVWNFLIFSLNTYFRFLINYMISIDINKGLKYLVKLIFYRIQFI